MREKPGAHRGECLLCLLVTTRSRHYDRAYPDAVAAPNCEAGNSRTRFAEKTKLASATGLVADARLTNLLAHVYGPVRVQRLDCFAGALRLIAWLACEGSVWDRPLRQRGLARLS